MSWDMADFALRLLQVVLVPLLAFVLRAAWQMGRQINRAHQSIDGLSDRQASMEAELRRIDGHQQKQQQALDAMPGAKSYHELSLAIERMNGNLREVSARMEGVDRLVEKLDVIVSRQEQFLLTGRK